jgi:predicted Zn-dependent peptidase
LPTVPFHHATLPNGLDIIAELDDRSHSVAAGFFVKAGSRDETPEIAGVSHFLEHMIFKGTPRRDALAVNRDFDKVGAKHNAQTSEEDTVYHVAALPEYFAAAFDVLTDILRPSLRAEDFETEKQVIIEEIRMYQDNPMMVAYEEAKSAHFSGHPLGQSVLGTVDSIHALSVEQMRAYFQQRYGAPNIVLAVAGRTTWDEILDLARHHCGGWSGPAAPRVAVPARGRHAARSIARPDDSQQTLIAVADGPPLESADRYAAALLATILGDHTGSRLYWELIDPGHADGVEVAYQDYTGAGAFFTFLSCDPDAVEENLARIERAFLRAAREGISDDELERACNKVQARVVLRGERPMGRLMSLGFHWAYRNEHVSVEQELDAYARVNREDIRRMLDSWPLVPMTVVSVGPHSASLDGNGDGDAHAATPAGTDLASRVFRR